MCCCLEFVLSFEVIWKIAVTCYVIQQNTSQRKQGMLWGIYYSVKIIIKNTYKLEVFKVNIRGKIKFTSKYLMELFLFNFFPGLRKTTDFINKGFLINEWIFGLLWCCKITCNIYLHPDITNSSPMWLLTNWRSFNSTVVPIWLKWPSHN